MRFIKKNHMETVEIFRPTYQDLLESNMSARAFCGQIGRNESHFYYWQAKIRKETARQNIEFLPVSLQHLSENLRKPVERL